ncbi:SELM protein, partial [Indicator maculatus]|nr:SELM protein [Indicator maculatus]
RSCPQVKAFVTQDIPLYHNLEMKHLPGADPELVLLSYRYEELEVSEQCSRSWGGWCPAGCQAATTVCVQRIPLSDMTREEINHLVQELGFYRKEAPDAPVPEEFQFAPAGSLPTLPPAQAPGADSRTPPEQEKEEHPDL